MQIEPPRPQVTVEGMRLLMDLMASCEHYTKQTGRSFQEDLELIGFLEGMEDELKANVPATFIALANTGFNLYGDHRREEYYYDATRDYVSDAVEKAGLAKDQEDTHGA